MMELHSFIPASSPESSVSAAGIEILIALQALPLPGALDELALGPRLDGQAACAAVLAPLPATGIGLVLQAPLSHQA